MGDRQPEDDIASRWRSWTRRSTVAATAMRRSTWAQQPEEAEGNGDVQDDHHPVGFDADPEQARCTTMFLAVVIGSPSTTSEPRTTSWARSR